MLRGLGKIGGRELVDASNFLVCESLMDLMCGVGMVMSMVENPLVYEFELKR
jgi:hypothetical protein